MALVLLRGLTFIADLPLAFEAVDGKLVAVVLLTKWVLNRHDVKPDLQVVPLKRGFEAPLLLRALVSAFDRFFLHFLRTQGVSFVVQLRSVHRRR